MNKKIQNLYINIFSKLTISHSFLLTIFFLTIFLCSFSAIISSLSIYSNIIFSELDIELDKKRDEYDPKYLLNYKKKNINTRSTNINHSQNFIKYVETNDQLENLKIYMKYSDDSIILRNEESLSYIPINGSAIDEFSVYNDNSLVLNKNERKVFAADDYLSIEDVIIDFSGKGPLTINHKTFKYKDYIVTFYEGDIYIYNTDTFHWKKFEKLKQKQNNVLFYKYFFICWNNNSINIIAPPVTKNQRFSIIHEFKFLEIDKLKSLSIKDIFYKESDKVLYFLTNNNIKYKWNFQVNKWLFNSVSYEEVYNHKTYNGKSIKGASVVNNNLFLVTDTAINKYDSKRREWTFRKIEKPKNQFIDFYINKDDKNILLIQEEHLYSYPLDLQNMNESTTKKDNFSNHFFNGKNLYIYKDDDGIKQINTYSYKDNIKVKNYINKGEFQLNGLEDVYYIEKGSTKRLLFYSNNQAKKSNRICAYDRPGKKYSYSISDHANDSIFINSHLFYNEKNILKYIGIGEPVKLTSNVHSYDIDSNFKFAFITNNSEVISTRLKNLKIDQEKKIYFKNKMDISMKDLIYSCKHKNQLWFYDKTGYQSINLHNFLKSEKKKYFTNDHSIKAIRLKRFTQLNNENKNDVNAYAFIFTNNSDLDFMIERFNDGKHIDDDKTYALDQKKEIIINTKGDQIISKKIDKTTITWTSLKSKSKCEIKKHLLLPFQKDQIIDKYSSNDNIYFLCNNVSGESKFLYEFNPYSLEGKYVNEKIDIESFSNLYVNEYENNELFGITNNFELFNISNGENVSRGVKDFIFNDKIKIELNNDNELKVNSNIYYTYKHEQKENNNIKTIFKDNIIFLIKQKQVDLLNLKTMEYKSHKLSNNLKFYDGFSSFENGFIIACGEQTDNIHIYCYLFNEINGYFDTNTKHITKKMNSKFFDYNAEGIILSENNNSHFNLLKYDKNSTEETKISEVTIHNFNVNLDFAKGIERNKDVIKSFLQNNDIYFFGSSWYAIYDIKNLKWKSSGKNIDTANYIDGTIWLKSINEKNVAYKFFENGELKDPKNNKKVPYELKSNIINFEDKFFYKKNFNYPVSFTNINEIAASNNTIFIFSDKLLLSLSLNNRKWKIEEKDVNYAYSIKKDDTFDFYTFTNQGMNQYKVKNNKISKNHIKQNYKKHHFSDYITLQDDVKSDELLTLKTYTIYDNSSLDKKIEKHIPYINIDPVNDIYLSNERFLNICGGVGNQEHVIIEIKNRYKTKDDLLQSIEKIKDWNHPEYYFFDKNLYVLETKRELYKIENRKPQKLQGNIDQFSYSKHNFVYLLKDGQIIEKNKNNKIANEWLDYHINSGQVKYYCPFGKDNILLITNEKIYQYDLKKHDIIKTENEFSNKLPINSNLEFFTYDNSDYRFILGKSKDGFQLVKFDPEGKDIKPVSISLKDFENVKSFALKDDYICFLSSNGIEKFNYDKLNTTNYKFESLNNDSLNNSFFKDGNIINNISYNNRIFSITEKNIYCFNQSDISFKPLDNSLFSHHFINVYQIKGKYYLMDRAGQLYRLLFESNKKPTIKKIKQKHQPHNQIMKYTLLTHQYDFLYRTLQQDVYDNIYDIDSTLYGTTKGNLYRINEVGFLNTYKFFKDTIFFKFLNLFNLLPQQLSYEYNITFLADTKIEKVPSQTIHTKDFKEFSVVESTNFSKWVYDKQAFINKFDKIVPDERKLFAYSSSLNILYDFDNKYYTRNYKQLKKQKWEQKAYELYLDDNKYKIQQSDTFNPNPSGLIKNKKLIFDNIKSIGKNHQNANVYAINADKKLINLNGFKYYDNYQYDGMYSNENGLYIKLGKNEYTISENNGRIELKETSPMWTYQTISINETITSKEEYSKEKKKTLLKFRNKTVNDISKIRNFDFFNHDKFYADNDGSLIFFSEKDYRVKYLNPFSYKFEDHKHGTVDKIYIENKQVFFQKVFQKDKIFYNENEKRELVPSRKLPLFLTNYSITINLSKDEIITKKNVKNKFEYLYKEGSKKEIIKSTEFEKLLKVVDKQRDHKYNYYLFTNLFIYTLSDSNTVLGNRVPITGFSDASTFYDLVVYKTKNGHTEEHFFIDDNFQPQPFINKFIQLDLGKNEMKVVPKVNNLITNNKYYIKYDDRYKFTLEDVSLSNNILGLFSFNDLCFVDNNKHILFVDNNKVFNYDIEAKTLTLNHSNSQISKIRSLNTSSIEYDNNNKKNKEVILINDYDKRYDYQSNKIKSIKIEDFNKITGLIDIVYDDESMKASISKDCSFNFINAKTENSSMHKKVFFESIHAVNYIDTDNGKKIELYTNNGIFSVPFDENQTLNFMKIKKEKIFEIEEARKFYGNLFFKTKAKKIFNNKYEQKNEYPNVRFKITSSKIEQELNGKFINHELYFNTNDETPLLVTIEKYNNTKNSFLSICNPNNMTIKDKDFFYHYNNKYIYKYSNKNKNIYYSKINYKIDDMFLKNDVFIITSNSKKYFWIDDSNIAQELTPTLKQLLNQELSYLNYNITNRGIESKEEERVRFSIYKKQLSNFNEIVPNSLFFDNNNKLNICTKIGVFKIDEINGNNSNQKTLLDNLIDDIGQVRLLKRIQDTYVLSSGSETFSYSSSKRVHMNMMYNSIIIENGKYLKDDMISDEEKVKGDLYIDNLPTSQLLSYESVFDFDHLSSYFVDYSGNIITLKNSRFWLQNDMFYPTIINKTEIDKKIIELPVLSFSSHAMKKITISDQYKFIDRLDLDDRIKYITHKNSLPNNSIPEISMKTRCLNIDPFTDKNTFFFDEADFLFVEDKMYWFNERGGFSESSWFDCNKYEKELFVNQQYLKKSDADTFKESNSFVPYNNTMNAYTVTNIEFDDKRWKWVIKNDKKSIDFKNVFDSSIEKRSYTENNFEDDIICDIFIANNQYKLKTQDNYIITVKRTNNDINQFIDMKKFDLSENFLFEDKNITKSKTDTDNNIFTVKSNSYFYTINSNKPYIQVNKRNK